MTRRTWKPDKSHYGDPDLERWPASLVEAELADAFLSTPQSTYRSQWDELVNVAGSKERAYAIVVEQNTRWFRAQLLAQVPGEVPS